MASQTDEAERRVREQRALIERKLETLEGRVGDDLAHARARLQHHVTHAADTLPGGPQLIQQVEEHPTMALAGGLGIGVMAGMMSGQAGDVRRARSHNQQADIGNGGGSSGGGMYLGMLSNSLLRPLQPYMEDAAKQVIAGFSDRQRKSQDGRRSDSGGEQGENQSER